MDILGHPMLPAYHSAALKSWQGVVRQIFAKAYGKFEFSDKYNIIF